MIWDNTIFALGLPGHIGMRPNLRSFGHAGVSRPIGFADPEIGLGFAYAPNHMFSGKGINPRLQALVDTIYAAFE